MTRRAAAAACCTVPTRCPITRIGQTSISTYCVNATSVPIVICPWSARREPNQRPARIASRGSSSSSGRKTASTVATSSARGTTWSLCRRKRADNASPAPRPFTTRTPAAVSPTSVVQAARSSFRRRGRAGDRSGERERYRGGGGGEQIRLVVVEAAFVDPERDGERGDDRRAVPARPGEQGADDAEALLADRPAQIPPLPWHLEKLSGKA